ncbi:ABC transporter permease subunit, partial [Leisingera sp. F5]|uniref:amino acid ABC transporter permease n=1 Tax=Leisingera sp. F5 TaxID=1813816 RepID=UPI000ABFEC08
MSTLTDPPKEQFRLSMLLYDTRYRSGTIQVIAMFGFMLLAAWLINNTMSNLAAQDKAFDFGFFTEPAGYDINQRLLEYTSRDSHLRAALMGLLNTLVVAFLGCVTATILGVIIGVLRLSSNWLVARLMTIYVELFRNVPVLLWIVFVMAILIETLPAPRAFRGENPEATLSLMDSVAVTNRGVYIPEPLFSRSLGDAHLFGDASLRFDVSLDLIAILVVLGLSLFASIKIRRRADRIQEATGDRPVTWHVRTAVVVVPMVILLAVLGFHLGYPELKGFNFQGGTHMRNSLIALWLALSLYTAAFIA